MRILYVTTIGGTMTFFKSLIKELLDEGHTVDIATNENNSKVPDCYREWGCTVYPINTFRSPLNKGNLKAIKQLKTLVAKEKYDIVHCHTPIAAMCTRLACRKARKKGTKVFYTAHGFHFYKGAPRKNWMIYYPVEKFCARFTDVLITINKEDYALAQKKLKAKRVEYVPGVGIDVAKFADATVDRDLKRDEIGVPRDATLLLSVGELNHNKNHEVVIRALAELKDSSVHYGIAGKGPLHDTLISKANELSVGNQVHLLGFRKDIPELYKCSDVCVFPSFREGLGLAAIEGMAAGLPLIVSDNRGAKSYAIDKVNAIVCPVGKDTAAYVNAIKELLNNESVRKSMGEYNFNFAKNFEVKRINERMRELYEN